MEEYLQYMKTLRYQMNEVKDQTAKVTVEEQMLITTMNSMENNLVSGQFLCVSQWKVETALFLASSVFRCAKSDTKLLREEAEKMNKEKGQICAQILAKQRKIASLESDSSTLNQVRSIFTMEVIQQERVSSSKNIAEKRAYYTQVAEDIKLKLKQQQDWFEFDRTREMTEHKLSSEARETMMANLVSAKDKLDEIAQKTLKLVQENKKMNDSFEQVKCRANKLKVSSLTTRDVGNGYKDLGRGTRDLLSDKVENRVLGMPKGPNSASQGTFLCAEMLIVERNTRWK
ncbi:hypothetical protein Pint_06844 [Pistacia integerrima]|uniref:Uncharacterized protein n=1 Tax=Pistacia integerrima TaxID=434235 RepID=A0ACC0XXC7_9ROSI|nr:hypothetical protein Pint_06844 [Pistacia integerrima]